MRNRTWRAIWIALALTAAAIGLGGWLASRSFDWPDALPPAPNSDLRDGPAGEAAAPPNPSVPSPRREGLPLPPDGLRLRDTLADLKRRADHGEAGAACRLAAEMEYCDGIRSRVEANAIRLRRSGAASEAMAAIRDPIVVAGVRAAQRAMVAEGERLLSESKHCDGVPPFHPDERVRYWRASALAGDVAAQRHYAVGNAFLLDDMIENLDELRTYRREAEAIAWRAVRAGDTQTMLALAQAYSPTPQTPRRYLLAQSVRPDAVKSLTLLRLVQSRMPASDASAGPVRPLDIAIGDLEDLIGPEQSAHARRQAADLDRGISRDQAQVAQSDSAFFHGTRMVDRRECGRAQEPRRVR